jgi:hypothetical protein
MTKTWAKVLVVVLLASPVGLIAADKNEDFEQTIEAFDSKTRGAVQVKGETSDWFDVAKNGKSILDVPKLLNGTLALEPGDYEVLVNRTSRKVTIEVVKKCVLTTGTLQANGKGLYYYAIVGKERKVAPNCNNPALGKSIALFAGTYAVDVNVNLRKTIRLTEEAKIEPGKKTIVQ